MRGDVWGQRPAVEIASSKPWTNIKKSGKWNLTWLPEMGREDRAVEVQRAMCNMLLSGGGMGVAHTIWDSCSGYVATPPSYAKINEILRVPMFKLFRLSLCSGFPLWDCTPNLLSDSASLPTAAQAELESLQICLLDQHNNIRRWRLNSPSFDYIFF